MKLSTLIKDISCEIINDNLDIDILGLENNSSKVKQGFLFSAIKGLTLNGADFIDEAIKNGATAVITDSANKDLIDATLYPTIPFIFTDKIREDISKLASVFYPNSPEFICAVTGTNGKSSVVNFVRQMWDFLDVKSASQGTVGIKTTGDLTTPTLTTPEPIELHKNLNELSDNAINHLAIETSSHGIEQHRVDNVKITAAGYTNISNDHLDYHKTVEEYFNAKLKLFTALLTDSGTAVINIDDEKGQDVLAACKTRGVKVITYGENNAADIKLVKYEIKGLKQYVSLDIFGTTYELNFSLITKFQIFNLMCAIGLFSTSVSNWEEVIPHLHKIQNEKGRIEYIATTPNGANMFVDFGHNGDGLKKLLTEFRPYVKHNLICIAGCSGNRPEIRRIEMGQILNEYADKVIIVDDNPRGEDPSKIRQTLLSHCPKAVEIPNRYDAINELIDTSRKWDSIIICGTLFEKDKEFILNKLASTPKALNSLLSASGFNAENAPETLINLVSSDSNTIIPNSVFVGIKGFAKNGADFSASAIKNGAVALVVDTDYTFDNLTQQLIDEQNVLVLRSDNQRKSLADLAYNFYDKQQPNNITAVTGTSGKSSVVDFVRQIWGLLKLPAISLGTIGIIAENVYSKKQIVKYSDADYTTPVNGEVYKFLNYFSSLGVQNAAIELSSHGLDQYRMENIKISVAGFTNLGTDHLDFYGTEELYLKSKSKLFSESLAQDGTAVLNADVKEFDYLKSICEKRGIKIFSYGRNGDDLKIISQNLSLEGQTATVELFGTTYELNLKILGSFQLNNLMCALGMVAASTTDWQRVIPLLGNLTNALGRLEYMGKTKKGTSVYVDFSYKGEALENTLKTIRNMIDEKSRIINVFSTCGDIYEAKVRRIELGRASETYADISILTDDSPRFEDPQKIRSEVMKNCPSAIEIKTNRRDAIKKAMELGQAGDVILIAGKGHEDYVIFGDVYTPYSDQETVLELLNNE